MLYYCDCRYGYDFYVECIVQQAEVAGEAGFVFRKKFIMVIMHS